MNDKDKTNLLFMNCKTKENIKTICSFLWGIKPVGKMLEREGCSKNKIIPLPLLEKAYHGLCERYSFTNQGICPYFEEDERKDLKFSMYNCSLIKRVDKTNHWVGTVYGETLWEVTTKAIIKTYFCILDEKEGKKIYE